jgi:hypothetical protein
MRRRAFVKYGLGGGALLLAGGVGLSLQRSASVQPPKGGLKALTATQFAALTAAAAVLNPGLDGVPGSTELDVAAKIDLLLSTMDDDLRDEVGLILNLLENAVAGLLLDGRPRPFSASSKTAQLSTLQRWRHSRVFLRRAGYKALVGLIHSTTWAQPELWALQGYPGPPPIGAAGGR